MKAKVELAQAIVDTWEIPSKNNTLCRHCTGITEEGRFLHNRDCVVPFAIEIVEEANEHGW